MKIRIYRKSPDIPLPVRQTPGSAGLDIYAAEHTELMPGEVAIIPTGLIIESPPGYYFTAHIR
ncbi:MAG TPA: dUTP diphosphatase, partial [Calditrichia bacterium]|nr:dUTP diphosphatase [Calditrichia bacterium]